MQTRPEGMLYGYDPANRKLVTPGLLRAEVRRIIDMMQVPRIDILNIGILRDALDADADYLSRLADILGGLKQEGLIAHAAADSFSGARCYLAMIACGAFDSININFNLADDHALDEVIPAARARGMRWWPARSTSRASCFASPATLACPPPAPRAPPTNGC